MSPSTSTSVSALSLLVQTRSSLIHTCRSRFRSRLLLSVLPMFRGQDGADRCAQADHRHVVAALRQGVLRRREGRARQGGASWPSLWLPGLQCACVLAVAGVMRSADTCAVCSVEQVAVKDVDPVIFKAMIDYIYKVSACVSSQSLSLRRLTACRCCVEMSRTRRTCRPATFRSCSRPPSSMISPPSRPIAVRAQSASCLSTLRAFVLRPF